MKKAKNNDFYHFINSEADKKGYTTEDMASLTGYSYSHFRNKIRNPECQNIKFHKRLMHILKINSDEKKEEYYEKLFS